MASGSIHRNSSNVDFHLDNHHPFLQLGSLDYCITFALFDLGKFCEPFKWSNLLAKLSSILFQFINLNKNAL
jgi:hypothetical protein